MKIKIWKHTGPGHYTGSCIIVTAKTKKTAEKLIRLELDGSGLADEELDVEVIELTNDLVIHSVNGDY